MSFKADIITIFPGIILETEKYESGQKVPDPKALSFLKYGRGGIFSYSYLISHKKVVNPKIKKNIEEVKSKLRDVNMDELKDFTVVLNRDVDQEGFMPVNTGAQELLTFIVFEQNISFWINLDFVRILCFKGGGHEIFLNNQRNSFFTKQIYTLPADQDGLYKIRIGNSEKGLLRVMSGLELKNKERYKRVLTAISLYNEANRLHFFDKKSAIILMVSAFEALLELPRRPKKETFVFGIKTLLGFENHVEKWAGELYELRSQIVHGEVIEGEKLLIGEHKHTPHFDIAKESFFICLYQILERSRIARVNHEFIVEKSSEIIRKIVPNKEKVRVILKSKNNFSFSSFKKKKNLYREFILRVESLTHTDYSASNQILELVELIINISNGWMKSSETELKKINREDLKSYINYQLSLLSDLKKELLKIKVKRLKLGHYKDKNFLEEKIREVLEIARKMEPVVHPKERFDVSLAEFLDRSLRSLWATY